MCSRGPRRAAWGVGRLAVVCASLAVPAPAYNSSRIRAVTKVPPMRLRDRRLGNASSLLATPRGGCQAPAGNQNTLAVSACALCPSASSHAPLEDQAQQLVPRGMGGSVGIVGMPRASLIVGFSPCTRRAPRGVPRAREQPQVVRPLGVGGRVAATPIDVPDSSSLDGGESKRKPRTMLQPKANTPTIERLRRTIRLTSSKIGKLAAHNPHPWTRAGVCREIRAAAASRGLGAWNRGPTEFQWNFNGISTPSPGVETPKFSKDC